MYKLSKIAKEKFTYQDVMDTYPKLDYQELYHVIQNWLDQELIVPVKKSGMTSFRPSLYHEYKKIVIKQDYSMYTDLIKSLHPKLNISRYLSHPQNYVKQQEYIWMLSEFFWKRGQDMDAKMSVNEKSFEIWGDEKFLDSASGRKLLSYNGLVIEDFGCYKTPEPYFSAVYDWDFQDKAVIIIENKDTWYTISKLLKESAKKQFWDIPVAMLVYGEGNKAARQNGMTEFLQDYAISGAAIYYFGDIDAAGIDIYNRVVRANKQLNISRFMPGYKAMVRKAAQSTMRPTDDTRKLSYPEEFLDGFTIEEQNVIRHTLKHQLRIPQEILNYQDYRLLCR